MRRRHHRQPSGQRCCLCLRHGVGSAAVHGLASVFAAFRGWLYHPPPGAADGVAVLGGYQSVGQMVAGADFPSLLVAHGYGLELRDCDVRVLLPDVSGESGQRAHQTAYRAGGSNGRRFRVWRQTSYLAPVLLVDMVREAGRCAPETAEEADGGGTFGGSHRQFVAVRQFRIMGLFSMRRWFRCSKSRGGCGHPW